MPALLGTGTNYCTSLDAAQLRGNTAKEGEIQQWWLDTVDDLIDQHMGGGYKARTRVSVQTGRGNLLLKATGKAASVDSITEECGLTTRTLDPSEYSLDPGGRLIKRKAQIGWYWPVTPACWVRGLDYTITFVEPDLSRLPPAWRLAAADCVSKVQLWASKNKQYGLAITAADQESAGHVSTSASTTFPSNLIEELERTIKSALKKPML